MTDKVRTVVMRPRGLPWLANKTLQECIHLLREMPYNPLPERYGRLNDWQKEVLMETVELLQIPYTAEFIEIEDPANRAISEDIKIEIVFQELNLEWNWNTLTCKRFSFIKALVLGSQGRILKTDYDEGRASDPNIEHFIRKLEVYQPAQATDGHGNKKKKRRPPAPVVDLDALFSPIEDLAAVQPGIPGPSEAPAPERTEMGSGPGGTELWIPELSPDDLPMKGSIEDTSGADVEWEGDGKKPKKKRVMWYDKPPIRLALPKPARSNGKAKVKGQAKKKDTGQSDKNALAEEIEPDAAAPVADTKPKPVKKSETTRKPKKAAKKGAKKDSKKIKPKIVPVQPGGRKAA